MSYLIRSLALLALLAIVLLSVGNVRRMLREMSRREFKQAVIIAVAIYFLFSLTMTLRACGNEGEAHGGEGGIRTLEGR